MPAPTPAARSNTKTLGHVNLMLDTFIANCPLDDLRSITRALLATTVPSTSSAYHAVARKQMRRNLPRSTAPPTAPLFLIPDHSSPTDDPIPTAALSHVLTTARMLFGIGMGVEALGVLVPVVRATLGLHWDEDGPMIDALAIVDGDIAQAVQSSREQVASGLVEDAAAGRETVDTMRRVLNDVRQQAAEWDCEWPFGRAAESLEYLKL